MLRAFTISLSLVCLSFTPSTWATDAPSLPAQARKVLETHCFRCHGKDGSKEGGLGYVLDARQLIERKRVTPRSPDKSRLFHRLTSTDDTEMMPPETEKLRPTKAEIDIVRKWIEAGAANFPAPALAKRTFLSDVDVYRFLYDHLFRTHPEHRKYQRYFTLTHLHNNPKISAAQMRLYRAGVAKLLNSLSWKRAVVYPKTLDPHGAILAVDLRDLDWDLREGWSRMLGYSASYSGYPYAVTHDKYPDDDELNRLAEQVYRLAETKVPAVRADWFLATAAQPPLYHDLLNVPATAYELEKKLSVDVAGNYRRDKLVRAGFSKSGVSSYNRLLERHDSAYGAYWKSYDFRSSEGTGNLFRYPLGPLSLFPSDTHPYRDHAFVQDGGEIIFTLPNGLHGYMLVDGKDRRIDEGPSDVVRDRNETAGKNTIIVNGISCFACHKHGIINDFADGIRSGAAVVGHPKDKVRRIYAQPKVLLHLAEQDQVAYLESLEKIIGPYLRVDEDKDRDLRSFPEVISALASPYLKGSVAITEASYELGFADPLELRAAVKNNPFLRDRVGLRPWLSEDVLARNVWQSVRGLYSPYQECAAQLQRGTPVRTRRPEDLP